MQEIVDSLRLTFGQVAWALCAGNPPDPITQDRFRHLRQLGVPFAPDEQGAGSGNRQTYGFVQLFGCAVGYYAIQQRFKPKDLANVQVAERPTLRKLARDLFVETPRQTLTDPWVKSRGTIRPPMFGNEQYLRLHDKVMDRSGTYDIVTIEELQANPLFTFGDLVERFPNGETVPLVPLKRVMLQAVAWAFDAPETKPGPQ